MIPELLTDARETSYVICSSRLTAEACKILNALFGVAYRKSQLFSVPQLGYREVVKVVVAVCAILVVALILS